MPKQTKVHITARVSPTVRDRLIEVAETENRPISNLVETWLKEHIAKWEAEHPKPPSRAKRSHSA